MLEKVVETQQRRFYGHNHQALSCTSPVPPRIGEQITKLVLKARGYQDFFRFVRNTDLMEATVVRLSDSIVTRRILIIKTPQTPPPCCDY